MGSPFEILEKWNIMQVLDAHEILDLEESG